MQKISVQSWMHEECFNEKEDVVESVEIKLAKVLRLNSRMRTIWWRQTI